MLKTTPWEGAGVPLGEFTANVSERGTRFTQSRPIE
jgi:hypothetical protein